MSARKKTIAPKIEAAGKPAASGKARQIGAAALGKPGHPLYLQVAAALKEEILSGILPVGAQLPTERDLRARFSVSRFTVREALRQLRDNGLIVSRRGSGSVVGHVSAPDLCVLHAVSINDLLTFTAYTRLEIEHVKMMTVDDQLAERIGVPGGEEWLTIYGVRQAEGVQTPVCWTEYYISREFAAVGRLLPRHNGPIFPLIEGLFALNIAEVQQDVTAVSISRQQAKRYRLREGTAVLDVRRIYKDAYGKIVQVTINMHPTTGFRLSMTMRQVKG
jgi:DNA-binding GntR family transcriptional regulator